jgi:hypothetical protein
MQRCTAQVGHQTVVVLGGRNGYSSTVAAGYLKLGAVWVESTNLLLDCIEEKYFSETNELHLTVMTSINFFDLGNRTLFRNVGTYILVFNT